MPEEHPISALTPRFEAGFQLVAYGDCCIGPPEPGRDHEQHLEAVHAVMGRLRPRPDLVCFLGDMIWGLTREHGPNFDAEALRTEWKQVLAGIPIWDRGASWRAWAMARFRRCRPIRQRDIRRWNGQNSGRRARASR